MQTKEEAIAKGLYRPSRHDGKEGAGELTMEEVPEPPRKFDRNGKKIWRIVCRTLHQHGMLAEEYIPAIENYCFAYEQMHIAEKDLRDRGQRLPTSHGERKNPSVDIHRNFQQIVSHYEKKFGKTVADKVAMNLNIVEGKAKSKRAQYLDE